MKVAVQAENVKDLKEAVQSDCSRIRFGSEFCEWKIPSLATLEKAYQLAKDSGKKFSYVTPRISETNIENVKRQLGFLNEKGEIGLVFNDYGVLGILDDYPHLVPHLGRQLVFIPARCPWKQITNFKVGFMARRRVAAIFYQTNLNNSKTIQFYQQRRVENVDLDWIPPCFPYFRPLKKAGLKISVHLHLTPVTSTRRCHTARFVGIKNPEVCNRACSEHGFHLENKTLNLDFYLLGNTVFRYSEPSPEEIRKISSLLGRFEVVATMNQAAKLKDQKAIDALIGNLDRIR